MSIRADGVSDLCRATKVHDMGLAIALDRKVTILGCAFADIAGAVASGSREKLIRELDFIALCAQQWAKHLREGT